MDMVFFLSEKGETAGDAGAGRVGWKWTERLETILNIRKERGSQKYLVAVVVVERKCDSRQQDRLRLDRGGVEGAWMALVVI